MSDIVLGGGARLGLRRDFSPVAEEWDALAEACGAYPFQRRPWLEAWRDSLGAARGYEPALVEIRRDGRLIALLPLATRGSRPRRLEWMGAPVSDYSGPLAAPDSRIGAAEVLAAARFAAGELGCGLVDLDRNPALLGGEPNPLAGPGFSELHYASHQAFLKGDAEAFLKERLGAKGSYNLRRSERKLAESGALELVVAEDEARRSEIMAALVGQKRARFLARGEVDNFAEPAYTRFYERFASLPGSGAHLCALCLDGRPIAEHWGILDRKRLYILLTAFDEGEVARHSPGSVLIAKLARLCVDTGVEVLDFAAGDEEYKERWCEGRMALYRHVEGRGAAGTAAAWAARAAAALKRGPALHAGRAAKRFAAKAARKILRST